MKPLTRDITLTLFLKLSLLFALWWVCFKGVERPKLDKAQWMLGASEIKSKEKL